MNNTAIAFPDGKRRCFWCAATPEYTRYHDEEWGWPVSDDRRLFEKLCLEGFQSGLSWRTILEKRGNFRAAFANFEHEAVAMFDEGDVTRLLADKGIVRHRGKIEAVINNARRMGELVAAEGSLAGYLWRFEAAPSDVGADEIRATSPESVALSKDLKKRGWKFVGPTTAYAFMQSMGMVNDHARHCVHREAAEEARARFVRPV